MEKALSRSIRLMFAGSLALGAGMLAQPAFAQEAPQRVEITGSSIKRITKEGALPVQTYSKEDIAKTGVTTTSDLIAQLPAMQGFTTSSDSVGGSGGGIMTASLHDIGEEYTLVLLNGRRLAPRGSGSTIDLNSIPLSAIEKVEVLTDGASAIYGSDAIAGVVNFILKSNVTGIEADFRYTTPEQTGGKGWNASITGGFGDLDEKGYSVTMSYSHDRQDQLKSTQRDFAKSGIISFPYNGTVTAYTDPSDPRTAYPVTNPTLYFFNGSGNAIPGNARVIYNDASGVRRTALLNPYLRANGRCAPNTSQIGNECWFDYTTTVEIQPEFDRDSFFGSAKFKLGNTGFRGYVDAALSKFEMLTRIAPYPTGYFPLGTTGTLIDTYVRPYLTAEQRNGLVRVDARWRSLPAGNRETLWNTKSTHVVAGVDGELIGWDVGAGLIWSVNDTKQDYPNGWLLANEFTTIARAGRVDVFTGNALDQASQAALATAVYHGPWDTEKTSMKGFDARASRALFKMGKDDAMLGLGFDFRKYDYDRTVAPANTNELILFLSKDDPYGLKRDVYGMFGEMLLPVMPGLEVSGAVRYDNVGKVTNTATGATVNKDEDAVTYKLSGRFQPTQDVLLRASIGSGFKAPSMLEIGRPRAEFGVTSDNYSCPFAASDTLAQYCLPGQAQYNVYLQGYDKLRPEKSKQKSLGIVFEPMRGLSASFDFWEVEIRDQVTNLTEQQIFADPVKYRDLYTTKRNNATGEDELAIIQAAVNVGKALNRGIDWSATMNNNLSFGKLSTTFSGTRLLKSEYTRPGTDNEWVSSLGKFGENNSVSFRYVAKLSSTLKTEKWTHTATAKYRSGYQDQFQSAANCSVSLTNAVGDCVDVTLNVPSYTLIDWQTAYAFNKMFTIKGGVNNVMNKRPPMSLRTGGAGHQVGYDPRYTDSYGRTYYVSANVKF